MLVIGGLEDGSTPPAETRALFSAATGPRSLWLVPHGDHAEISGLGDAAYRTRILAFLRRTIGA